MLKVVGLWLVVFLLAAIALETASQYLITPIWLANVIAAVYAIKLRKYLSNYFYIFSFTTSAVLCASVLVDEHQSFQQQCILSALSGLQTTLFVLIYYYLIKHLSKFSYKRTVLLTVPNFFSTLVCSFLFVLIPLDGIWYMMFFDYFLEQIATGFSIVCIVYGLREYKRVSFTDYSVLTVTLLAQYSISINQLFYNCFIIPLVNVYFTIHYHFKRFVFVMGVLSLICSIYLVIPLSGQYWKEDQTQIFAHLSTYRVGIASFIIVFLILSELQMRHRGLTRYLEKVSFYDELTNLKNRRFVREKLLIKGAKPIKNGAVLLLDIDDFKKINDKFGHATGDLVLQDIAKILSFSVLGFKADVCRWGGEEFLILLRDIETETELEEIAERIVENGQAQLDYQGENIDFSISVGMAPFQAFNIENYHYYIDQADRMLYLAKHNGKRCYVMAHKKEIE